jgi:hypothetical protein
MKLDDLLYSISTAMLPSGWAWLRTYFFSTAMDLSKGNILCRNIVSRISISLTRWTRRCVIMWKNDGGNINSKPTRHYTILFCSCMRLPRSIILWEIALRKAHTFTMVNQTFSSRISRNATRRSWVKSTWQSWDFSFVNFFSSIFRIPFIFEEYPDGTLILLKHSNMLSFSSLLRV